MSDPVESTLAELAKGTPERPVTLGRYQVIGRLGRGGMGTVYEALDPERGTKVALKTLSAADTTAGVALKREFRVVADLAHPNLAPVYELATDRGLWFFTMEHVDGMTLTEWARSRSSRQGAQPELPISRTLSTKTASVSSVAVPESSGGMSWSFGLGSHGSTVEDFALPPSHPGEAIAATMPDRDMAAIRSAFADLVSAIGALHDAGLRHSDVKPSNVLVREDGRVVLVDFGLARPLDERHGVRLTSGGTPTYMPPEQLSDKGVGAEADWYALGATLYRVLTGLRPFLAGSKVELYFKKMHHPPPAPHTLLPEIPVDLSELSVALLTPEPEGRPDRDAIMSVVAGDGAPSASSERPKQRVFVGRDVELCALEQAYGSSRAGELTVVHAHGPSGIGKSALLTSFLTTVQDVDLATVLRGRCYQRETVPYKGFDRIVDELSGRLKEMNDRAVELLLPTWTCELARVFPALRSVPAIAERAATELPVDDAIELRRRAWGALGELLGTLRERGPIVLAIDDLQWADADSAQLLEALLKNLRDTPLMVVVLYRPEEADANPALEGYFKHCRRLADAGRLVDLTIEALRPREAEQLARAVLGPAATAERVSFVAAEAHGVPFFIEELAHFVSERGAQPEASLTLDEAMMARVAALTAEQRALVEVIAVASNPLPQSIVFEAAGLDAGALGALLALRSASLVSWRGAGADDAVSTYHDRIRESVLASLSPDATLACHLKLGRALAKSNDDGNSRVFDAVRHLGAAEPLLGAADERRLAAELHAAAGELARDAAAFPLSFDCFDGGIALLASDAWDSDYALALRLHAGAVEAAYLSANWPALERRAAEVKARSRNVMDQLVAWEAEIDAHSGRQEYDQALDAGLAVLAMLGVELPREPSEAQVGEAVKRTLERLSEIGPDGLRAMPDLADETAAAATRIQVRLSPTAYFAKPMLLPMIACHLVETSIDRGVSTATSYALALFGIVLNTLELFPVSQQWGELAAELLERWPDRRLEAATRHILNNLVCVWMVPLSSTLAPLREVFDIGCKTGDYEYASYAAHGYVHNSMYAARPLGPLLEEALMLGEQMRALGQVNALHVHVPFEQLLKTLTGKLADPCSLDDDTFDEAARLAEAEANGSRSGVYLLNYLKGYLLFHFGDKAQALAHLLLAHEYTDAVPSIWHLPIMHQLTALAGCAVWEQTDDDAEREALRQRIDDSLAALKRLAAHAPINFAHRVSMVEAERLRIDGDRRGALAKFEEAISKAHEGSWVNDVALANELAARCHDDPNAAKRQLRAARTGYAAWGATAKAEQLSRQIEALG